MSWVSSCTSSRKLGTPCGERNEGGFLGLWLVLRLSQVALLTSALLIGFAQISELPPFEGFDEIAHYSYIQQVAETASWPHFRDPVSVEIEEYLQVAPGPASLHSKWSYSGFFASSSIETGRLAIHSGRDGSHPWRPGTGENWESQHPPLYYFLMVPAYVFSKTWSLAGQLFLLRSISYVLAWIGLCLATFSIPGTARTPLDTSALMLAPALLPHLFPMWFPDMARLGNDSLVVLLTACGWFALSFELEAGILRYIILGIIFGLGLLTKATFLPFTLVTTGLLCVQLWQARRTSPIFRNRLYGLLVFLLTVGALSGWWYIGKYFETGSTLGSQDVIVANQSGGLINGLRHNASLRLLFPEFPLFVVSSFAWSGTWSFVPPPPASVVPFGLIILLLAAGYFGRIRSLRSDLHAIDCVPALTFAVLLFGLYYHNLIFIATYKTVGGPGYYLYAFVPILAPLVGYGLARHVSLRVPRLVIFVFILYPLLFLPLMMGIHAFFFSGCDFRAYEIASVMNCAGDVSRVLNNLYVLSYPLHAISFFVIGWVFMILGVAASMYVLSKLGSARPVIVTPNDQLHVADFAPSGRGHPLLGRLNGTTVAMVNAFCIAVIGALIGNWLFRRLGLGPGSVAIILVRTLLGAMVLLLMARLIKADIR
jgi:uncharacterized membrane protein YeaQ/YmgE (transglycosylase-associated protein family)